MALPPITHSPNISGAQPCTSEQVVTFNCSGSVSARTPDQAEFEARAQMNDAIIEMERVIGAWAAGLSCAGGCRLLDLIVQDPKGRLGVPQCLIVNRDDGSVIFGLRKLLFGDHETVSYICDWSVDAKHLVLCIPAAG